MQCERWETSFIFCYQIHSLSSQHVKVLKEHPWQRLQFEHIRPSAHFPYLKKLTLFKLLFHSRALLTFRICHRTSHWDPSNIVLCCRSPSWSRTCSSTQQYSESETWCCRLRAEDYSQLSGGDWPTTRQPRVPHLISWLCFKYCWMLDFWCWWRMVML